MTMIMNFSGWISDKLQASTISGSV